MRADANNSARNGLWDSCGGEQAHTTDLHRIAVVDHCRRQTCQRRQPSRQPAARRLRPEQRVIRRVAIGLDGVWQSRDECGMPSSTRGPTQHTSPETHVCKCKRN